MRWVGILLTGVVSVLFATPVSALAPNVIDPTVQLDAEKSVIVSSVYTKRGETFVELYNNSERPVNLAAWRVRFITASSESDVMLPAGWLLPDTFIALSEGGVIPGVLSFAPLNLPAIEAVSEVRVIDASETNIGSVSGFPADITSKWYQRKSSGVSGTFVNDFSAATSSTKLRHTPLYIVPAQAPSLRIVEIYPHASDCSPADVSILCGDYIKLYNPSAQAALVADYRLRSDSASSESSNAFHLDRYDDIPPGGYLTVSLRDDGDKMSLTDDGGWVWLEDAEGVKRYDETLTSYPSASSATKIGNSWALTDSGVWQWTPTPMPDGANSFPIIEPGQGGGVLADVTDCPQGKYRNPETNRCRNIEDAIATLAACAEGQFRNPETNRCRSLSSVASASLTPCSANQERNPETNRCRNLVTTATVLAPCLAGQERNPETNRCRKTLLDGALSPAAIEPARSYSTTNPLMISLIGAAGAGAIGYGIYEWRSELSGALRRLTARVGKK